MVVKGSFQAGLRKQQNQHFPSWLVGQSQALAPLSASRGMHPSFWGLLRDSLAPPKVAMHVCCNQTPPCGAKPTHLLTQ